MQPLPPLEILTGEKKHTTRVIFAYSNNQTPSYVPNYMLGSGTPSLESKYSATPVEQIIKNITIKNLVTVTEALKSDIQNAAETRFQLFIIQLLAAHKTHFIFFKYSTEGQGGEKTKKQNKKDGLPLAEAHASTLPSLLYITKEDSLKNIENPYDNMQPLIFDKNNKNRHTTTKLPTLVNQVDTRIDEKTKPKRFLFTNFRDVAIRILNECSTDAAKTATYHPELCQRVSFKICSLKNQNC